MLALGIPSFRLEKNVLNAEIDVLKKMGVKFKCGVEVGKDVTIAELRKQGYKGFYVAIGAQKSAKLNVPGEDLKGVWGGVDFLREVNLGNKVNVGKKSPSSAAATWPWTWCRTAGASGRRGRLYNLPPLRGRDARRSRGSGRGHGRGRAVLLSQCSPWRSPAPPTARSTA
jgi:hypothetical protein